MIKTTVDGLHKRVKGSSARVHGFEPVLGRGLRESVKKREDEFLKDFDGRAEKGDRAIGERVAGGFTWLWKRDDVGCLPKRRDVGVGDRQIEERSQETDSAGAKILQMNRSKTIRSEGGGSFGLGDGLHNITLRKRRERVIEGERLKTAMDPASTRI